MINHLELIYPLNFGIVHSFVKLQEGISIVHGNYKRQRTDSWRAPPYSVAPQRIKMERRQHRFSLRTIFLWYPLVMTDIAGEKCPYLVSFPMKTMWFSIVVFVYRVNDMILFYLFQRSIPPRRRSMATWRTHHFTFLQRVSKGHESWVFIPLILASKIGRISPPKNWWAG